MSTPKSITSEQLPLSVPVKAFGLRLTTDATATAAGDPRPSPPVPAKRPTVTILALAALLVVLLTVLAAAVTPRPAQALTPPSYHQIENRQVDSCVTVPTTVFPPKANLLNSLMKRRRCGGWSRTRASSGSACSPRTGVSMWGTPATTTASRSSNTSVWARPMSSGAWIVSETATTRSLPGTASSVSTGTASPSSSTPATEPRPRRPGSSSGEFAVEPTN